MDRSYSAGRTDAARSHGLRAFSSSIVRAPSFYVVPAFVLPARPVGDALMEIDACRQVLTFSPPSTPQTSKTGCGSGAILQPSSEHRGAQPGLASTQRRLRREHFAL